MPPSPFLLAATLLAPLTLAMAHGETHPTAQTPTAAQPQTPLTHPAPSRAAEPSAPKHARAQADNPNAPVPAVVHRSALRGGRASEGVAVESWPQANRLVYEVGGWRSYLRQAHGLASPQEPHK